MPWRDKENRKIWQVFLEAETTSQHDRLLDDDDWEVKTCALDCLSALGPLHVVVLSSLVTLHDMLCSLGPFRLRLRQHMPFKSFQKVVEFTLDSQALRHFWMLVSCSARSESS
jgi:hypothetical protein